MILTTQKLLLALAIFLVLKVIRCDAGLPPGLEFKQVKFCGPYDDHTAKIKISPWPYIKSGERMKASVTFTPAVDVFAATFYYQVTFEADGQIVVRAEHNACREFPELCSLPADETHIWTYSPIMRAFPPGFKGTYKAVVKFYNEEYIMFLCFEIVATVH